jgi:hypothetical protein
VKIAMPATTVTSEVGRVRPRPASIRRMVAHKTLRRPKRLPRLPIQVELTMPTR